MFNIQKVYTFGIFFHENLKNMKTLSLKLQDDIFQATESMLEKVKKSRNSYINEALEYYNRYQRRKWLEKQFAIDAELAGEDSAEMARSLENLDSHLID